MSDSNKVTRWFNSSVKKIAILKRHLRLNQWEISLTMDPVEGMCGDNVAGELFQLNKKLKTATIKVIVSEHDSLKELHSTILHEMLHLKIASLSQKSEKWDHFLTYKQEEKLVRDLERFIANGLYNRRQ